MINIAEWNWTSHGAVPSTYAWNISDPMKSYMLKLLQESPHLYTYQTVQQLMFELDMRASIIQAAQQLNDNGADFTTFKQSRANVAYWLRTPEGGFKLLPGQKPSDAISDIYASGHLYGFECATAIIIIFYKAALELLGERNFNTLFNGLYLYSWEADHDLGITTLRRRDFIPGDTVYFKNPDVDPAHMEFQGENAIIFGPDTYYGHGMGISSADHIIANLNRHRRPGSQTSAYMLEQTTRPNFQYLAAFAKPSSHQRIIAKFGRTVSVMS